MITRTIWCCACLKDVEARLTDGREIYPHRPDLADHPRWKCDTCGNHVGCHNQAKIRNPRPLGNIPTPELSNARRHIHAILDPLWQSKRMTRSEVYTAISNRLGYRYHTAEIKTLYEARCIYFIVKELSREQLA